MRGNNNTITHVRSVGGVLHVGHYLDGCRLTPWKIMDHRLSEPTFLLDIW